MSEAEFNLLLDAVQDAMVHEDLAFVPGEDFVPRSWTYSNASQSPRPPMTMRAPGPCCLSRTAGTRPAEANFTVSRCARALRAFCYGPYAAKSGATAITS